MSLMIKKIYSISLSMLLAFGMFTIVPTVTSKAHAQTCSAGDTLGNLYGYAMTENHGPIYMSTESWNDDPLNVGHGTSNFEFSVSYNRNINTWDGFGWAPEFGTVDFGAINSNNITSRTAELTDKIGDPRWGNTSTVVDLSAVSYDSDPGGFEGLGYNGTYTINGGGEAIDVLAGLGNVDFSNVQLIESPCAESVDLILGTSSGTSNVIYKDTCDIEDVVIKWTTTDVVLGSCVTGVGLWSGGEGATKPDNNISGENATGDITTANSPVVFRLICTGAGSGSDVVGTAIASCGPVPDDTSGGGDPSNPGNPIDPTDGVVIPEFKEV